MIGIKPAPGDHESNFKIVGAIPSEPLKLAVVDFHKIKHIFWASIFLFKRNTLDI